MRRNLPRSCSELPVPCASFAPPNSPPISQAGHTPVLLDVREPWEWNLCRLPGAILIPMRELPARLQELNKEAETVVICHHGVRSYHAARYLETVGLRRCHQSVGRRRRLGRRSRSGHAALLTQLPRLDPSCNSSPCFLHWPGAGARRPGRQPVRHLPRRAGLRCAIRRRPRRLSGRPGKSGAGPRRAAAQRQSGRQRALQQRRLQPARRRRRLRLQRPVASTPRSRCSASRTGCSTRRPRSR